MSQLADKIFKGKKYGVSSKFGWRIHPITKKSEFHRGTDYATNNIKLPQYAVEDGVILSCGTDSKANGYAKYVWVKYPRLNKKMLHYHLDSISVRKGQSVDENTILGNTGRTGHATGIHLHLAMVNLSNGNYENADSYVIPEKEIIKPNTYKVKAGDTLTGIGSKFGINWKQIASLNNIKGPKYIIYTNQVLNIPAGKGDKIKYIVQKGDYLIKIARKFGVSWLNIARDNNIKVPYTIKVGQELLIIKAK